LKLMNFEVFREIFRDRIKGKAMPRGRHNGALGHWIEDVFDVPPNSAPEADLHGFEIKSGGQKGSFGDWMGDWYIWYDDNSEISSRNDFIKTFGTKKRPDKPDRFSWTGVDFGKIVSDRFSECGQKMSIDSNDGINIHYNFMHDNRLNKNSIIPEKLRTGDVLIARYSREKMANFVNRKFGQKGWVLFSLRKRAIDALYLGKPFYFEDWIEWVRSGEIELDSGMNTDTSRNRSKFRAKKSWWYSQAFEIVQ